MVANTGNNEAAHQARFSFRDAYEVTLKMVTKAKDAIVGLVGSIRFDGAFSSQPALAGNSPSTPSINNAPGHGPRGRGGVG